MNPNVKITLKETINKYDGLKRNAVAVQARVRPATINELCSNDSKAIRFDTLQRIVDALNTLTGDRHTIDDVITIEYNDE